MQTGEMIETWKRWEGQLINGQFLLGEYLGGSGLSAVFVTEIGGAQRNKGRSSWFLPIWKMPRAGWRAGGGWPNCLTLIYCVCLGWGAASWAIRNLSTS